MADSQLNVTKLILAAEHYANHSPALSAFLMQEAEKTKKVEGLPGSPKHLVCQFCGSIFRPANHRTSLVPSIKVNNKLRHLVERQENGSILSKLQSKLVDLYTKRQNRIVMLCLTCNNRTVIHCQDNRKHKEIKDLQNISEPVNLSRAEKRKLKKKQLRQANKQKQSQSALSGLDLTLSQSTLTPKFTSTPVNSSTLHNRPDVIMEAVPMMSLLNETPDVASVKSMVIGAPKSSSTPKGTATISITPSVRAIATRGATTPQGANSIAVMPKIGTKRGLSPLVKSVKNSSLPTELPQSKSKKKAEKKKASQNVLQKMLAKKKKVPTATLR